SEAQKDLSTEYAKDIQGVKDVKNEMTVAAAPAGQETTVKVVTDLIDDASITAQIRMSLLFHRSTSALKTKVETKDGVVTLGGMAKNSAEKELVTKLVNDINGVKTVVNNMSIDKAVSKSD
ncbi:BON domain-containing protein, partial [Candidatus Sumerlaeota bacterium]|nr:BON domain-containing protein [Candidatus Sumerlaeota bacterium]